MIEMIALVVDNRIICVDGQIPIILEAHLERFRNKILNKNVVMGRITFESLGGFGFNSAANTIILSRSTKINKKNIHVENSVVSLMSDYKDFIVIGGQTCFADFMPVADKVYITEVSEIAEPGQNFKIFPSLNNMKLTNPNAEMLTEGDHYYRFLTYKRA